VSPSIVPRSGCSAAVEPAKKVVGTGDHADVQVRPLKQPGTDHFQTPELTRHSELRLSHRVVLTRMSSSAAAFVHQPVTRKMLKPPARHQTVQGPRHPQPQADAAKPASGKRNLQRFPGPGGGQSATGPTTTRNRVDFTPDVQTRPRGPFSAEKDAGRFTRSPGHDASRRPLVTTRGSIRSRRYSPRR